MEEKKDPWPDEDEHKEVKYNANIWEAFCNFESCERDTKSESFNTFFTRWQSRLEKMELFGIVYPDQLLVMKLTYACHLDLATVLGLLNVLSDQNNGRGGGVGEEKLWMKAKDILCEIKHEVDEAVTETLFELETKDELVNADVGANNETNLPEFTKVLENVVVSFDDDHVMEDVMDSLVDDPDFDDHQLDHHKPVQKKRRVIKKKGVSKLARKRKETLEPDESFPRPCDKCGLQEADKEHFMECHNSFYCSACSKSFPNKEKLDVHVSNHVPEACPKCGQLQLSHGALRRHLRTSSCADKKECPVCGLQFNPKSFKKHVASHTEVEKHECTREGCKQSFIHPSLLEEHVTRVHDKVKNFECDICQEKFFTEDKMKFHKKCKHEDLPLFCERCGKSGVGVPRQTMKTHLNMCSYEFECKLCAVKFANKEKYDKHVSKHTEHTCTKCNKVLPTNKKFRQHMSYSSCAERVMCKFCGEHFSPGVIKRHEGKHKSDQNYQCPREGCDECFHNEIRLKRHLDKHDGIRNYTCDVCSKGFFSAKDVKKHKDFTHLKIEGKHVCGICGKKYHTPYYLEVHVKSHTGEKGFPCNICEKAFTRKCKLKKHIAIVHEGVKPEVQIWSCQMCSKEFTKQYNLMRHYKSVHKIEDIYGTMNMKPVKLEEAS